MSWQKMKDRVADRSGVSKADTNRVLSSLLELVLEDLVAGETVVLPKIGSLSRRWRKQRIVRSIHSARKRPVDANWAAGFRSSSVLRDRLRELTPNYFQDKSNVDAWRVAEALIGDLELYHNQDAPKLTEEMSDQEVLTRCAEAFGEPWDRVTEEYGTKTKVQVDFLSRAARRCWTA